MPYIINRYSTATSADPGWPKIVNDGTIDTTTELNLLGRGKTNYGPAIAENFVRLMENFASNTSPQKAITGQLWYKVDEKSLYVCTKISSNPEWQKISNITVSVSAPSSVPSAGEFYLHDDGNNKTLYVSNGSELIKIGGLIFSNTTPVSANNGDLWFSSNNNKLRIFVGYSINDWIELITTNFAENSTLTFSTVSANTDCIVKFSLSAVPSFVLVDKNLDVTDYVSAHPDLALYYPNGLKEGLNSLKIKTYEQICEPVEDNIVATGASAPTAYQLTKTNNFVTSILLSSDGVMLPPLNQLNIGLIVNIWNLDATNPLKVYTHTGTNIDGNVSDIIPAGAFKSYVARNTNQYRSK